MTNFISAIKLSNITGYTTNAIRQKRRLEWKNKVISKKEDRITKIDIFSFNQWCASKSQIPKVDLSDTQIQFIKFNNFYNLYKLTMTQLSRFCDAANLNFNSLVVNAPDGNNLINITYYHEHLILLLKHFDVI